MGGYIQVISAGVTKGAMSRSLIEKMIEKPDKSSVDA
jgi:hypothetical protein